MTLDSDRGLAERIEVVIQRLDEADMLVEGELSARAEAPNGCSIDLEVVTE